MVVVIKFKDQVAHLLYIVVYKKFINQPKFSICRNNNYKNALNAILTLEKKKK